MALRFLSFAALASAAAIAPAPRDINVDDLKELVNLKKSVNLGWEVKNKVLWSGFVISLSSTLLISHV
jgi:hypothetical protein